MNAFGPVLQMQKVSKNFGGLQVLQDIDLELNQEEIVGLIGPNGAGKSTLFNIITSIYRQNHGEVFLQGKRISGLSPHKICHLGISRTFQLIRSFLSLTVLQNVMVSSIYGHHHGSRGSRQRAMEALDLVGLSDKGDIIAAHMTLSDRRLMEVAMALASVPVVTLLDEPMAGLNPSETQKILQLIKKVRDERKISILWVEHKMDAIFDICDRVVVLDYGIKIADGNPEEIAKNEKVIELILETPLLEIENVNVFYGDAQALWDASLKVEHHKITALLGSNGAGKSTLLRTISGLIQPREGQIVFVQKNLAGLKPEKVAGMGISHVPEGRRLFVGLTVMENLELGAYLPDARPKKQESLDQVFELFPVLKDRLHQVAGTLSGGEQQMLAIGRAMMARPSLLLLDEPSLGLAPRIVKLLFEIIKKLNENGATILLVEQNIHKTLEIADYAYVLRTGVMQMEGYPEELIQREDFRDAFLGKIG